MEAAGEKLDEDQRVWGEEHGVGGVASSDTDNNGNGNSFDNQDEKERAAMKVLMGQLMWKVAYQV